MTIIYSTEDRIPVEVDGITFKIAPLSYNQKNSIQSLMDKAIKEGDMKYARDAAVLSIKYAVKSVEGLKKANGDSYQLVYDDGGLLNDKSVDDLLNIHVSTKLATVCSSLVNGITGKVYNEHGQELEGVSFKIQESAEKK